MRKKVIVMMEGELIIKMDHLGIRGHKNQLQKVMSQVVKKIKRKVTMMKIVFQSQSQNLNQARNEELTSLTLIHSLMMKTMKRKMMTITVKVVLNHQDINLLDRIKIVKEVRRMTEYHYSQEADKTVNKTEDQWEQAWTSNQTWMILREDLGMMTILTTIQIEVCFKIHECLAKETTICL